MCHLSDFGVLNEEIESKIRINAKKLSKIGHFENFDFWSMAKIKVKVNDQWDNSQSMVYTIRVSFGLSESGHRSSCRDPDMVLWHGTN